MPRLRRRRFIWSSSSKSWLRYNIEPVFRKFAPNVCSLRMRILVLGINYWPEETGIGPVTVSRCEYLASRGHDVTMCTSFPYYPEWRIAEPYRGKLRSVETRNGVRIVRSWLWVPESVTSAKRVAHEASFIFTSTLSALGVGRPDVIFVLSPPLGLAASVIGLKKLWRVPYVYDVQDLQPDAAAELGMLRNRTLLRFLYRLEKAAYENAAVVTTLTSGMRERIIAKGIPAEKVVLIRHGADPELFRLTEDSAPDFRQRYGFNGDFLVSHTGNMGIKQGLDVLLGAAEQMRDTGAKFLLVGDGADRPRLEQMAAERGLRNVHFMPLLERKDFHGLLMASDVCVITQQKSVSDIVFPSKSVTLLAAGRPVVASVNDGSEVARAMRTSGGGTVVEPENAGALSSELKRLQANPHLRTQMAISGRSYAEQTWVAEKTLSALEDALLHAAGRTRQQ